MNRTDLQSLAELRIKDARVLLDAECFEGAYYLAGYAVECALKACIAKQTREHDFPPDPEFVRGIYTHNLAKLQRKMGVELDDEFQNELRNMQEFNDNWAVVKDWSEHSRYISTIGEKRAKDLLTAMTDPKNGVLQWLTKRW